VSEYQRYEFVAFERPLTPRQMAELRTVSTRAEITPTRFFNEYHWGDFKGNAVQLVARYFDAHLYLANWGTRRLILRLKNEQVSTKRLRPYFVGGAARALSAGKHVIVELCSEDEESEYYSGGSDDDSLAALAPLRTELLEGDFRVAYLAWLLALQAGDVAEDATEPPNATRIGRSNGRSASHGRIPAPRSRSAQRRRSRKSRVDQRQRRNAPLAPGSEAPSKGRVAGASDHEPPLRVGRGIAQNLSAADPGSPCQPSTAGRRATRHGRSCSHKTRTSRSAPPIAIVHGNRQAHKTLIPDRV
jgi:hypothetical protein